jgi:hypothetical protein
MVQVIESSTDENLLQNVASLMIELKTAVDTANR